MGTSSNFGNMLSMALASAVLPFLPMPRVQILLNNFLYDFWQLTIPTDNVDASYTARPRKWDTRTIQRFMFGLGPISSVYDFLTFGIMLWLFHAGPELFHAGWFIESLATHTLVIFVIRTAGNPFKSRPSTPLLVTVFGSVILRRPRDGRRSTSRARHAPAQLDALAAKATGGAGTLERLLFLSDGVFAIAMTLLVVALAAPELSSAAVGESCQRACGRCDRSI